MSSVAELFGPTLIRASAGSGKTFTLSNRFIALLAHGERPERILATTFTRKAAGEILERVYARLAKAALDPKAASALGSFISKPNFSSAEAQAVLKRLTEQQARLNICTLDSFFVSIAQSFSLELGLVPGWMLSDSTLDACHVREAITALCATSEPADLAELLTLVNKGNSKTAIHAQLEREVSGIYSAWRITSNNAWDWIEVPKGLTTEQLSEVVAAIGKIEIPRTKSKDEPDKNWTKAISESLQAIANRDWQALIEKGICPKLLGGESSFNRHEISDQCRAAFTPLIIHLRAYFLGRLRAQTMGSYRLLGLYAKEFESIRSLAQALNFEGVKQSLVDARVMGELAELYYRLDSRISHLLLDEFQDTSRDEWLVLEPVVAEILSKAEGEQSFFCVGDTKQAIYGWRGGAAQIFETLEESFPILSSAAQRRDESRRSAPEVIQTVNQVFESLPAAKCLAEYSPVVDAWSARFDRHTTAQKDVPGYVELRAVDRSSEDSEVFDDILIAAAELVTELQHSAPQASIGVLMRGNAGVAAMLGKLWDRGIRASGEGGNPLTDSWHVGLVLAALRVCEHPGDTISAFLLVNSELGKHLQLASFDDLKALESFGLKVRSQIEIRGLGDILKDWAQALSAQASLHDKRRLRQLVELAYAFNYSRAARISDFIEWVKRTPVENPAASLVRVMTIHKSKGLEFDAVVLPELDDRVPKLQPPSLLRLQNSAVAPPTRISRYADKHVRTLDARLSEMHEQAKHREVEEALSVLYVALTRARSQLYMFIESKPSTSLSFANILRETLAPASDATPLYAVGNSASLQKLKRELAIGKKSADSLPDGPVKLAASKRGRRRGLLQEVTRKMPGPAVDLASYMRLDGEESALKNSLFRKLRRHIDWLPARALSLKELAEKSGIDIVNNSAAADLLAEFTSLLTQPGIHEVFTPRNGRTQDEAKVHHELPFAFRREGLICSGSLSRLVVYGDGTAEVFEFDLEDEHCKDTLDTRLSARRTQLETYREAAAACTGLAEKDIDVTLVCLGAGQSISLGEKPPKTKSTRRG